MHFVEELFGFAPDNGSGSLEFLLFATPLAILSALYAAQAIGRKLRAGVSLRATRKVPSQARPLD